jgi:hypothetical protein
MVLDQLSEPYVTNQLAPRGHSFPEQQLSHKVSTLHSSFLRRLGDAMEIQASC